MENNGEPVYKWVKTWDLAEAVYNALKERGAEIGNMSIPIIDMVLIEWLKEIKPVAQFDVAKYYEDEEEIKPVSVAGKLSEQLADKEEEISKLKKKIVQSWKVKSP